MFLMPFIECVEEKDGSDSIFFNKEHVILKWF